MKSFSEYLIIGNGPAGTSAAGVIRRLEPDAGITILSFEQYPYYARPRLPALVRGDLGPDQLPVFKPDWYTSRAIGLLLGRNVSAIDTDARTVTVDGETAGYGKLLLATGAAPFIPPIEGAAGTGVLTLRTIEDALRIRGACEDADEVVLIGGGLLGLELADHLADGRRLIRVIEFRDSLLPDHLSAEKGIALQGILESRGFRFHLGTSCSAVSREDAAVRVITDGGEFVCGAVIVSAGVRARTDLAVSAGIPSGRGILVDRYLRTGTDGVFAAGDCIEQDGRLWGFVKSAMEQGRIAGENMVTGGTLEYNGTEIDIKLKVSDIDLSVL